MKIVLDTCVFISGMRSDRGASYQILQHIARGTLIAAATPALFLEYEEVLYRPEHRLVHRLSVSDMEIFLADFAGKIMTVSTHFQWRPQLKDANDEMVLEAAINGHAEAITTFNEQDFLPAALKFGTRVMSPSQVLRRIKNE